MVYQYDALPDSETHIRLFSFQSGGPDGATSIRLEIFELSGAPPYTALSYTWGTAHQRVSVLINGEPSLVQYNCAYALEKLRMNDLGANFWIDALCIDQNNDLEKGYQVQLMVRIYGAAQHVAASCGPLSPRSDYVLADLTALASQVSLIVCPYEESETDVEQSSRDLAAVEELQDTDHPDGGMDRFDHITNLICNAVAELSRTPYWSRLWIVQELAFASDKILLLRAGTVSLEVVASVASSLYRNINNLTNLPWPAHLLNIKLTLRPWTTRYRAATLDLADALRDFGRRGCSDARDHVYGLLNLVEWPGYRSAVKPDYTVSPFTLARRVLSCWPYAKSAEVFSLTKLCCELLVLPLESLECAFFYKAKAQHYTGLGSECSISKKGRFPVAGTRASEVAEAKLPARCIRNRVLKAFRISSGPEHVAPPSGTFDEICVRLTSTDGRIRSDSAFGRSSKGPGLVMHAVNYVAMEPGDLLLETGWGPWNKGPWIIVRPTETRTASAIVGYMFDALSSERQSGNTAILTWTVTEAIGLKGAKFDLEEEDLMVLALLENVLNKERRRRAGEE